MTPTNEHDAPTWLQEITEHPEHSTVELRRAMAHSDLPAAKHVIRVLDWADAQARLGGDEAVVRSYASGREVHIFVDVPRRWETTDPVLSGIGMVINRTSSGSITHLMTQYFEWHPQATKDMESDGWEMIENRAGDFEGGEDYWDAIRHTFAWHGKPTTTLKKLLDDQG